MHFLERCMYAQADHAGSVWAIYMIEKAESVIAVYDRLVSVYHQSKCVTVDYCLVTIVICLCDG